MADPRILRLRMRWLAALAIAVALAAMGPAHTANDEPRGQRYYLSLGDSLAFGFQRAKALAGLPPSAFNTGYADLLADRLEPGGRRLALVNYGCPGESTVTFRAGPCPWTAGGQLLHDAFTGPQQDAALGFLRDHRGHVELITLSLWGNDVNAYVASCQGNVQCIVDGAPAEIAAIRANLATILGEIRRAAPDATVILLGGVDVNAGAFELTHPLIRALNTAMADVAAAHRSRFANPFPIFNPDGDTGAALCTRTLLCSDGDVHPSDAGYRAIADLIQEQLPPDRR